MLSPVNRFGGARHSRIVRSIRGGRPHRGRKDDQRQRKNQTAAPRCARSRAVAQPRPRAPPVTTATWSRHSIFALRQISQQFRAALWWDLKGIFEQHRERSSYGHEYLERPWAIILQDAHVYHHLASGTCRAETELVGWACRTRTQKRRRKLSL